VWTQRFDELNLKSDSQMNTPPQSDWLTATEAAAYLKVKTRSLLRWVRLGNMQAYALSGTKRRVWRFRKEDLDSALLSKPVVSCVALPVRSGKGANN
jgi:excisionase family DNA binding protein